MSLVTKRVCIQQQSSSESVAPRGCWEFDDLEKAGAFARAKQQQRSTQDKKKKEEAKRSQASDGVGKKRARVQRFTVTAADREQRELCRDNERERARKSWHPRSPSSENIYIYRESECLRARARESH